MSEPLTAEAAAAGGDHSRSSSTRSPTPSSSLPSICFSLKALQQQNSLSLAIYGRRVPEAVLLTNARRTKALCDALPAHVILSRTRSNLRAGCHKAAAEGGAWRSPRRDEAAMKRACFAIQYGWKHRFLSPPNHE